MRKEDLTVPALLAEAVTLILGIVYIGMQIYYGISYHVAPMQFLYNIISIILVYLLLSILSCYPEKINRLPKAMCTGKIRTFSVRMVRLVKMIFVIGLMIPCVADVAGTEIRDAFSLVVIFAILFIVVYYEARIFYEIRSNQ
ncbi:MAG: hypothetical protein NC489_34315 [Ruminococcus flavefaciens]|nr:hypothetical protein [Ruminococcus flavefaciens]